VDPEDPVVPLCPFVEPDVPVSPDCAVEPVPVVPWFDAVDELLEGWLLIEP